MMINETSLNESVAKKPQTDLEEIYRKICANTEFLCSLQRELSEKMEELYGPCPPSVSGETTTDSPLNSISKLHATLDHQYRMIEELSVEVNRLKNL